MSTYSKELLSGSTDGKGVKITGTAIDVAATTIHTGTVSSVDLVTLFAYNDHTADVPLTLGWGGTVDSDNLIVQTIPAQAGLTLVAADMPIQNSLSITGAAGTVNVVVVYGYVNRIT